MFQHEENVIEISGRYDKIDYSIYHLMILVQKHDFISVPWSIKNNEM